MTIPFDFLSHHFTHGERATAYRAILLWEEEKRVNQPRLFAVERED